MLVRTRLLLTYVLVAACVLDCTQAYFGSQRQRQQEEDDGKNCFCEVSTLLWWMRMRSMLNWWCLFAQLKGSINDCSCTVDTVDYFNNNKVFPRLRSLLLKDYFRFYRVNLHKQCPFWEDDSKCAMRFCSVSPCADKDIPQGLRELNEEEPEQREAAERQWDEERPYEKVYGWLMRCGYYRLRLTFY